MKRIAVLCLVALLLLAGCGRKQEEESPYQDVPNPIATITLQDGSVMRAELFLQDAPNTVANFVELANSGFYDGLEIFRVVTGVLIQTGDPNNDGTGGPGYSNSRRVFRKRIRKSGISFSWNALHGAACQR